MPRWVIVLSLLAPGSVFADAMQGGRVVDYFIEIENLDAYPEHYIVAVPFRYGEGFVVGSGVNLSYRLTGRLANEPRLLAIPRDAIDEADPGDALHEDDDGELEHNAVRAMDDSSTETLTIHRPYDIEGVLVSEVDITSPGLAPRSAPIVSMTRRLRVTRLDEVFEVELVEASTENRDGSKLIRRGDGSEEVVPAPTVEEPAEEIPVAPREATAAGCGSCSAHAGSPSLSWLLLVGLLGRRRTAGRQTESVAHPR